MTKEELELGQLVHLNSGSPMLTVTDIDESEEMVTVEWITEAGIPQQMVLPIECVKEIVL